MSPRPPDGTDTISSFCLRAENTLKALALCAASFLWKEKSFSLALPATSQRPSPQSKEIGRKLNNVPCIHSLHVGKNKFNIAKINSQYLLEFYLNYNVYAFFNTTPENGSTMILPGLSLPVPLQQALLKPSVLWHN